MIGNSAHKPSDLSFQLSYGIGGAVEGVVYTALNFFLMFYMVVIIGLSPSLAGIILLISLVIDALTDPVIGSLSDNSRSPGGRRHSFMIVAIFPLCILLGLLFSIPSGLHEIILFVYVLLINILLRLFLGIFAIPFLALSAELWPDYQVRSRIALIRCFFFSLATIGILYMAFSLFFDSAEGISDASAYPLFGWVAALLALLCGLFCWNSTRGFKGCICDAGVPAGFSSRQFLLDVAEMSRNGAFCRVVTGLLVAQAGTGIMFSMKLLTLTYFWKLSGDNIEAVILAFPVGFFLGVPVAKLIIGRVEKRTCIIISNVVMVLTYSFPAVFGFYGIIPVSSGLAFAVLMLAMGLIGLVSMTFAVAYFALIPDVVDEHDLMFNTRREGVFFAVVVFSTKVSAGLGSALAAFGLSLIGFSDDLTTEVSTFPEDVAVKMVLLWGLAPAVFYLLSTILFSGYRISKKRHAEILEKLATRRAAAYLRRA